MSNKECSIVPKVLQAKTVSGAWCQSSGWVSSQPPIFFLIVVFYEYSFVYSIFNFVHICSMLIGSFAIVTARLRPDWLSLEQNSTHYCLVYRCSDLQSVLTRSM